MNEPIRGIHARRGEQRLPAFFAGVLLLLSILFPCARTAAGQTEGKPTESIYPGLHWQHADRPEDLGWSSETLAKARAFSREIGSAAVMIVANGVVVDAWGDIAKNYQCHSMRKSIISALIGIRAAAGDIDLSATLEQLEIDDAPPSLTSVEKQATVHDLLKARSGVYHPALGESEMMKAMRPPRHSHAPGTFWYYNNWDFNALGTIFEQETGAGIFEDFAERVAAPLQMEDFDPGACRYLTRKNYKNAPLTRHRYYLFRMSARDLARFGLLFLRQGRWKDRQVVPEQWVRESTTPYSEWGVDGGYGYMWWTGIRRGLIANVSVREPCYYASGAGGHKVVVLPYRNLVVVHRVDTDTPGPRPMGHQFGRLLWLILSAAGETDIGPDPSIGSAGGVKLTGAELKDILKEGCRWECPNLATFPGGRRIVISCAKDGALFFSSCEGLTFEGKWWLDGDRFSFDIIGIQAYFEVVRNGKTDGMYDPSGTLFGKFTPGPLLVTTP